MAVPPNPKPDRHRPSALSPARPSPRTQVSYACGYEHKPGSFGMWHGPNPVLEEMLEAIPEDGPNPVIIEFKLDGTDEVIYRWDAEDDCWVKTQP